MKDADNGIFKLSVKGSMFNVGDEKLLRMEGFHTSWRKTIQQQVDLDLEDIRTDEQTALWVALMEHYLAKVYPLLMRQVNGVHEPQKSLPTLLCGQLVDEWTARLRSRAGGEEQAERLLRAAREALFTWTDEIPGSTSDVYAYEVNLDALLPKRVLKREVLKAGWSLGGLQQAAPAAMPRSVGPGATTAMTEPRFRAFINKKQEGPWSVAEIAQQISAGVVEADTRGMEHGLEGERQQVASSRQCAGIARAVRAGSRR